MGSYLKRWGRKGGSETRPDAAGEREWGIRVGPQVEGGVGPDPKQWGGEGRGSGVRPGGGGGGDGVRPKSVRGERGMGLDLKLLSGEGGEGSDLKRRGRGVGLDPKQCLGGTGLDSKWRGGVGLDPKWFGGWSGAG